MKKIAVLMIVSFVIISSFSAVAYTQSDMLQSEKKVSIQRHHFIASTDVTLESEKTYFSIQLKDHTTFLASAGKPKLPKIVERIELPFGVTNIEVSVDLNNIVSKELERQVQPASALLPLTVQDYQGVDTSELKDMSIYSSCESYPGHSFEYDVGCGLNEKNERVTFVTIDVFPIQYSPGDNLLSIASDADIVVSYENPESNPFPLTASYDLVIIAPDVFIDALEPLVDHKNDLGVKTFIKPVSEIYTEYDGVDKPEQIKFFIKDAVETLGLTYVLLVGGLNSVVMAKPKDDTNHGSSDWYMPVRYTNMYDDPAFPLSGDLHDPGVISDLYYADLYMAGGAFSSWDGNGDGVFAALGKPGIEDDPTLDYYPDVSLGRLACRSIEEVNTVVSKIITYESSKADPSWFEKMIVVSGDGFLDQTDLNIQWDTKQVANGEYTIKAQSFTPYGTSGPITSVNVVKDDTQESVITYSHDDHLNPAIQDAFENGFPTDPVAEIVSVSEGDILGSTDVAFEPLTNAYCNEFFFWANVSYIDEVLTIRGKSYDPKPYGNVTSIHIWIEDSQGSIVFSEWRNDTEMYYEGEWTTGEKALLGRGGALYYMPESFEREILWCSNGKLNNPDDVISAVSEGAGFLFFSGHGSPNVWADQYPGIPGDRGYASVTGLEVTKLSLWGILGVLSFTRSIQSMIPLFPMDTISNGEKLPIAVVGGCHNSQFNVSMIPGMKEGLEYILPGLGHSYMWCHGSAVPETFSWRLISNPNGGAIASMGNTGLGYGMPGKELTTGGGDSWITIEFFKQYGANNRDILGNAYTQTLNEYVDAFDMTDLSAGHPKTMTQWVLLGDPTLKIGGYE